jgi:hypothetical protein
MKIKSFTEKMNESIDEASLKDNPAIPGEGGREGDYLKNVEGRARQKMAEMERRYGQDIPAFMSLVRKSRGLQAGKEKELERLAEDTIKQMYGDILDGVNLNIRFPKENQIQKMMSETPEEPEEERLEQLRDADVISEVQRRKIANNITQGEAKNTKLCLNLPEVRDGLIRILGEENGKEYLSLLNKITDIASLFDWAMPMEIQLEMWKRDKSGFSGSVSVEWETPKENTETEDIAQKILAELEDDSDIPEETEELFDMIGPTINALGTDFAMLLHETVKGIYELIAANAIPNDEETAETIILNTDTLADELEDLRYGPEIAADLRDFINEFPESSSISNLRERVFGKMMLIQPAQNFLDLMFLILNKDRRAKFIVQKMIDEIKKELGDYELQKAGLDSDEEEYSGPEPELRIDQEKELSQLSQREIQELVDKALDDQDYDRVRDLSKYLKESKRQLIEEKIQKHRGF